MKKWLLITACMFIAFAGCGQNTGRETKKAEYLKISAEEAKKILDENNKAILLDVRSEAEFKEVHITGAALLPLNEINDKAATMLPDKDAVILVYCRSGARSRAAANALILMGYTKVYDIGGINSWPYSTEKG